MCVPHVIMVYRSIIAVKELDMKVGNGVIGRYIKALFTRHKNFQPTCSHNCCPGFT